MTNEKQRPKKEKKKKKKALYWQMKIKDPKRKEKSTLALGYLLGRRGSLVHNSSKHYNDKKKHNMQNPRIPHCRLTYKP
jgi:hypothetical protein